MLGRLKRMAFVFVVLGTGLISAGVVDAAPIHNTELKSKAAEKAKKTLAVKAVPTTSVRGGRRLDVKSGAALVVEQTGGDALFQKNASAVVPIASISKLMTAMVVLDSWPDLQTDIYIGDEDVDYLRGSRSRLHVGANITRETALLLTLMSSENRAAHALARHYPGGIQAFLAAMNDKARSLGMRHTHFEDPTGLSSNNVSTAHDLAKMVVEAYRYPLIREFSTMAEATVEVAGRQLEFHNTNPLVMNASWDVGLSKTGYIHEAGKCLVMQARVADRPVVIVLLDSVGKLTRVGDANRIRRWMETTLVPQGGRAQRAA
ncbi:MAG: D-alanyl-D-alanine endopeptidase [Candidatus Accumulibacter sp.]|jgi:D-alanyl-D-alanine endopeptidase (penicillin-binding protein 7)|nr:D-alanyl-D-alanine endopeptidase [Accumulibacter sp.]